MKNIGTSDRILRLIFGILLLAFAWWQTTWLAFAFALFTFYEALTSWCVFFHLIGKNTCPVNLRTPLDHNNLDSRRLALAGGIVWGLSMFVLTILSLYTNYAAPWLQLVGSIYPGYTISWEGSIIGLVYGFIDAAVGLFLLAWLYNKLK